MSEVTDVVVPILRTIQADLSGLDKKVDKVDGKVDGLAERMGAFEGYFTYTMGLTSRNTSDIETVRQDMAEMKERLAALENARS